jgi:hypothetical protein
MKQEQKTESILKQINQIIASIDPAKKNVRGSIAINAMKQELVVLREHLSVPRIHVSKLKYEELAGVIEYLCRNFPEYLAGHTLLEKQKPPSETHSLHFVKEMKGRLYRFVHIIKIDLKFGTGVAIQKGGGTTEYYPGYSAEGIILSSMIIPVTDIIYENGIIADFVPIKILKKEFFEAGDRLMVHAIFDDFDPTEINEKIYEAAGQDIFPFSHRIFPFISYAYFTSCISFPDPLASILDAVPQMIEPLIAKIFAAFGTLDASAAAAHYPSEIILSEGSVSLSEDYRARVKKLFSRYSSFQDDDLMLKRWRRLDVSD